MLLLISVFSDRKKKNSKDSMFLWDFYMNEKMWNSVRHWFTFVEVEPWQPQSLSSDRGMVYYVALSSYPPPLKDCSF